MELPFRKPINSRKSRKIRIINDKFTKENYWKGRKNRVLHQLSRANNESDHDEFLLPETRLTRWDIHRKLNNEKVDKETWKKAADKLISDPPHLEVTNPYLEWYYDPLPMPTLERCPTIADYSNVWTIHPELQEFYARNDFTAMVNEMREILCLPRNDTYDIYANGIWTTHNL